MKKVSLLLLSLLAVGLNVWADDCVPAQLYPATAEFTFTPFVPEGALFGAFSISESQQVFFSKGNLQYNAGDGETHNTIDGTEQGTWRFAEHQYDYIGNANSNVSQSYDGWIDAISWATSGWNSGATNYQPWQTLQSHTAHFIQGSWQNHMYDYPKSDWGYFNVISNGGNKTESWRTLKAEEWNYLLNTRTNASQKKGMGKVNNVNGCILLPDAWTLPNGLSFTPIGTSASYSANQYTVEEWIQMEQAGAVFLPSAGYGAANGSMSDIGTNGYYWTSTVCNENCPYTFAIISGTSIMWNNYGTVNRDQRASIRLVIDIK